MIIRKLWRSVHKLFLEVATCCCKVCGYVGSLQQVDRSMLGSWTRWHWIWCQTCGMWLTTLSECTKASTKRAPKMATGSSSRSHGGGESTGKPIGSMRMRSINNRSSVRESTNCLAMHPAPPPVCSPCYFQSFTPNLPCLLHHASSTSKASNVSIDHNSNLDTHCVLLLTTWCPATCVVRGGHWQ